MTTTVQPPKAKKCPCGEPATKLLDGKWWVCDRCYHNDVNWGMRPRKPNGVIAKLR